MILVNYAFYLLYAEIIAKLWRKDIGIQEQGSRKL